MSGRRCATPDSTAARATAGATRPSRFRDQVIGAEFEPVDAEGGSQLRRNLLACQLRECVRSGEFHRFVDLAGADVECAAEDVGESQHVVHLIGVVCTARCDDHVGACRLGLVVGDFGIGIRQRHDQRVAGHRPHHVGVEHAGRRNAQEDVGADERFAQRRDRPVGREFALDGVEVGAAGRDYAPAVAHRDLVAARAEREEHPCTGDGGRTGAVDDDLRLVDAFPAQVHRVDERCRGDDRRSVLVVVHDRNVQLLDEPPFDLETFGSFYVFEIDPAEGGGDSLDGGDELLRIGRIDLDVEGIDSGEVLEKHAFALHDRFGGQRADVAQSQYGGSVGNDRHQIALDRIVVRLGRIVGDRQTRRRHAGRVGQREIVLGGVGFRRPDFDFAGASFGVIGERFLHQFVRVHKLNFTGMSNNYHARKLIKNISF